MTRVTKQICNILSEFFRKDIGFRDRKIKQSWSVIPVKSKLNPAKTPIFPRFMPFAFSRIAMYGQSISLKTRPKTEVCIILGRYRARNADKRGS